LVGTEDVVLVVLALVGVRTDQLRNDTSPCNLWRQAMVERRDGPSWLRDDDDDDE